MSAGQKIKKILADAGRRATEEAFYHIDRSTCESEIERLMIAAFYSEQISPTRWPQPFVFATAGHRTYEDMAATAKATLAYGHQNIEMVVIPQTIIDPYRADFICFGLDVRQQVGALAVECDGHAFHEKTKEQAQRDKFRDRCFISNDIPVMRFTGSEIWRDATDCVGEVQKYFNRIAWDRKTA